MDDLVPEDDLPDNIVPADDLPGAPSPVSNGGVPSSDLPDNLVPANDLPTTPLAVNPANPKGLSAAGMAFTKNYQPSSFSLSASPAAQPQARVKVGEKGYVEDISDKQREMNQMKNAAIGFFNSKIKGLFLNPDFINLPAADQDYILDQEVSNWEKMGLPAGQFNEANPTAFQGIPGKTSLRDAVKAYVAEIRDPNTGLARAHEMGGIFDPDKEHMIVQQAPDALQTMGLEAAKSLPGLIGGNLAGEIGGAAGGAIAGTPGAIVGGIGGSIAGAFGAEKLLNDYAQQPENEWLRNGLERINQSASIGEEEHAIAALAGRLAAQFGTNQIGFQNALRNGTLAEALAPRLGGGAIGGGIEAASELGRGEDLDPSRIGEAAFSGTVFNNPRFMPKRGPAMTFEGRNWIDTNAPVTEHYQAVDSMLRSGASPAEVLEKLGTALPDTIENRRALRVVSADIRHGRDPSQSMEALTFRPKGLTVDDTISAINEHTKGWENAPDIQVHDSYDSETIPDHMKDRVGPGTLGWKDENGAIHIVASQHIDPAAVSATMYHEGMHEGLVRAYQGGLEDKLVSIYDNASPNLRDAIVKMETEQKSNNPDWDKLSEREQKALVTDEVLASTSENGIPKKDFDKVAAFIRNFGRTHLGELGKKLSYSDAEIRSILSTGHDAVSKGQEGGVGPTRYLNFGLRSQGADLDSLQSYEDDRGVPKKPEYPEGWFEGAADAEPRYEVSDKDAYIKPDIDFSKSTLSDVLNHPRLFEAYPQLKEVKVRLVDDPGINGSWSKADNTIELNPNAPEPLETLLHEVQHAIQDHEGWARGANTEGVYRTAPIEAIHQALKDGIEDNLSRVAREEYFIKALKTVRDDPNFKLDDIRSAYKKYIEGTETYDSFKSKEKEFSDKLFERGFDVGPDFIYSAVKSDRPLDWHLSRAEDSAKTSQERLEKFSEALHGDEWDARRVVRHSYMLKEKLYNRSGGEYEARAAASRRTMTDEERLANPQFTTKDERGVAPHELYTPSEVADPNSDMAQESTPPGDVDWDTVRPERPRASYTRADLESYVNRINADKQKDQLKQVQQNLRDRDKARLEDTRFSRKYSGSFSNDYEGRQNRTEDLIQKHWPVSAKNLTGMMRPLEEYKGVTQEEIINAAQELKDQGFDAGLAVAQGAIPDNSGFVVALSDLVRDKLETASEIAGRYRSSGGMRHERELMRAVTELGQVMSVFDKTASNLGRMLYSLRLRIDEADDAGLVRLFDRIRFANGSLDSAAMDQIAQALLTRDPIQIRKAVDRFDPAWKKYGQSLFYNFILGSKAVQIGNILGNSVHIAQKAMSDILGYGAGLGREGVYQAGNKLGLDVRAPDRLHSDEVVNRLSGLLAGLMNKETYNAHRAFNVMAKEFLVRAGESEHENKFASQQIPNLPLSLVLEYGTRGLQASDAFFRTVVENSAMHGLATREARRLNGGQKPTTEQIADVMASPTREMLEKVKGEADRITFQEDPAQTASNFSRFMRSVPGGWLIAPIIRTPANIGRAAFESFDPTGRITKRNREALRENGPEADRVRGQQLMAAALWAGALYLMNEGMLNGGGPSNPQARAQWLMAHVPYSIGDEETGFYPLRGISPIGDGLSMIADLKDAYKFGTKDPEMTNADKAMLVASGMGKAFLSNSYLSSVTDQLDRGIQPTIQNLLGTLVQSAASIPVYSQVQKERDPFVRDTSSEGSIFPSLAGKASLMDNPAAEHYFQSVKPREELPIRRDIFGEPIEVSDPTSDDPVSKEVGRLVDATGRGVVPGFNRTVKGERVPNEVYNNFLSIAGPIMRDAVSEIMKDPVYKKTLNDEQRAAIIRSNKNLKGLHARLQKQLQQMMLDRKPEFENNYIPDDLKTLSTIPGE